MIFQLKQKVIHPLVSLKHWFCLNLITQLSSSFACSWIFSFFAKGGQRPPLPVNLKYSHMETAVLHTLACFSWRAKQNILPKWWRMTPFRFISNIVVCEFSQPAHRWRVLQCESRPLQSLASAHKKYTIKFKPRAMFVLC